MKAAFYRPDYQKLLIYPLIKDLAEHLFQNMRQSLWKDQLSFWNILPSFWDARSSFWGLKTKLKVWPSFWKARPRVCVITWPILSQWATGTQAYSKVWMALMWSPTDGNLSYLCLGATSLLVPETFKFRKFSNVTSGYVQKWGCSQTLFFLVAFIDTLPWTLLNT